MRSVEDVAIELLADHEWLREDRLGVPHFRPGQLVAEAALGEDGEEVVVLGWTPAMGHSIKVITLGFEGSVPTPDAVHFHRDGRGVTVKATSSRFLLSRRMEDMVRAVRESRGRASFDGRSWGDEPVTG